MFLRQDFSLRNTIFLRLIITFLLIMLPILLSAVYLYHWVVQTASADITKTAAAQTAFYLTDLENEIERIKLLQFSLLEDDNLNELALAWETMATIDRTENMNSLMKRLYTVQNSSMYIKDVSVHIATIDRTMSALGGVRGFEAERYREIRSVFGGGSQVIEWNGGLFLGAMKQRGTKGAEPLFTVQIELDPQKLQEALAQFNTYPGSGTLLLSDSAKVALASGTGELSKAGAPFYIREIRPDAAGKTAKLLIAGNRYYAVQAHSADLGLSIYRFIPEQVVQKPLSKFYKWAWVFAACALGIFAAFALSTYKFIHKPMLTLVKSFRRMEQGDLSIYIAHESKDEFRYLYGRFNQMVENLRSLIDQVYKQKIMAQRAELKQLQSQINPHFLYNSFFILNTMAKTGDTERIEQFTTLLGEYFEFVTRNASDLVALEQEIHHARMYAEIQELRFSRRIQVRFDPLPDELRSIPVPRLIVQPIIENAFKHSLEKKVKDGLIAVRFEKASSQVRIIVEDNGDRLADEALKRIRKALHDVRDQAETTGMVNIHRRIRITFGEDSGLQTERSELGGLRVTILLADGGDRSGVQNADR
ncbi:MAG: histidine kinase [Paenibacillus macerans]|uniref:HAMP domain-containing protein n=1 Tax=Paenibacillus macerans TaxID=44252 RepID=A0A6N8ES68_PAEMA|nr:histidine kinase [Paenibacillus macerans]MBS5912185.1 histidine kinase [Paenibacillus macerans]MDU7473952.1 histidine kinase [Paenibacillus macerans]MEC0137410.1 histidine kinase [Paenibacillus macerans]MUG21583.1 HAMP domain-containing protein [Paenibacillus macerans]UMV46211.1 histidine kinase [Paenibacillus macerans]